MSFNRLIKRINNFRPANANFFCNVKKNLPLERFPPSFSFDIKKDDYYTSLKFHVLFYSLVSSLLILFYEWTHLRGGKWREGQGGEKGVCNFSKKSRGTTEVAGISVSKGKGYETKRMGLYSDCVLLWDFCP